MTNHPNRGKRRAYPTKEQVRAAREAAGLTQPGAAELIHCSMRTWQQWEAGERRMHAAMWELFQIKALGLTFT